MTKRSGLTWAFHIIVNINGFLLATGARTHTETIWTAPELPAPLNSDTEVFLDDLMTSGTEVRPLLMFASSQKPSYKNRLPSGPDFILEEQVLLPPAVNIPPQRPNNNGYGKPSSPAPATQTVSYRSPVFQPPPLTYGFTPRSSAAPNHGQRKARPLQNPQHPRRPTNAHNAPAPRHPSQAQNYRGQADHRASGNTPSISPSTLQKTFTRTRQNEPARLGNNHRFVQHAQNVREGRAQQPGVASVPVLNDPRYRYGGNNNEGGRKFVIFHAPSFVTTPRPSSAPYLNKERINKTPSNSAFASSGPPPPPPPPPPQHQRQPDNFHGQTLPPTPLVPTVLIEPVDEPPIVIDLVTLHDVPLPPRQRQHATPRPHETTSTAENKKPPDTTQTARETKSPPESHTIVHHHHRQQLPPPPDPVTETFEKSYEDLPYLEPEYPTPDVSEYQDLRNAIPTTSLIPTPQPTRKITALPAVAKKPVPDKKLTTKQPKVPVSFGFASEFDGAQTVPGRPGADYPVYNEVPFTNFDCRDYKKPGFYADLEAGCQVFHNCDTGMKKHSFICPNGTIFHQELFICDWWYNVHCDDSPNFYNLNAGLYVGPPKEEKNQKESAAAAVSNMIIKERV